ncbi:MAG: hypothetical protein WD595_04585 [Waddliaceae bacterium]
MKKRRFKEEELLEPVSAINFVQLSFPCQKLTEPLNRKNFKKHQLPETTSLTKEDAFADVAIGWGLEGVEILIHSKLPYIETHFPDFSKGDAVEIMIDTRDNKSTGFNTRFCHHFFFLPESIEGTQAGEITHFRTEDRHLLCDPSLLSVSFERERNGYYLHAKIPREALHGYAPDQFHRLGFTYCLYHNNERQHFSVLSEEFSIAEHPALWASLNLS